MIPAPEATLGEAAAAAASIEIISAPGAAAATAEGGAGGAGGAGGGGAGGARAAAGSRGAGGEAEYLEARLSVAELTLTFQRHLAILVRVEAHRREDSLRLLLRSDAVQDIIAWLTSPHWTSLLGLPLRTGEL
ncbi:unnamed protein product [Closterium sp. NIES-54]